MLGEIASLVKDNKSETAFASYKDVILAFSKGKSVLEIGAGRRPIFTAEEIEANDISYVANDIIKSELDLIPFHVEKAVFDIVGDIPQDFLGKFDFVFSKMVQEHVSSGEKYYKNIYKILSNDAVSLNFFPTLFHPFFTINYILPDKVSSIILRAINPYRNNHGIPKFPAYYQFCRSTDRQVERLKECGFREVYIIPFYGQHYLKEVPLLSSAADYMDNWFRSKNLKVFSSFAYSIVKK